MPATRTLVHLLIILALVLHLAARPALGQSIRPAGDPATLTEIQGETARLRRLNAEIAQSSANRRQESERLATRLGTEELTLRSADVHLEDLRAARLELDAARSRIRTLEGQIAHRQAALVRLQQRLTTSARTLAGVPAQDLDGLSARTALRLGEEAAAAQHALVDGLQQLLATDQRFVTLGGQRLRLLQGRIRLDTIDWTAAAAGDPRVPVLESSVTELLRETAGLAIQVGKIQGDDPATVAQGALLEQRLHDTATRAYLRQNDLDLLGLSARVEGLSALRGDNATPRRLLAAAADELQAVGDDLRGIGQELVDERRVIESRRSALRARTITAGPAWTIVADLDDLIGIQEQDLKALLARIAADRVLFVQQMESIYPRSLTERVPLPGAPGEWQRIVAGFGALPTLAAQEYRALWKDLRGRTQALTRGGWATLLGGALLLVAATLRLAWWLRRHHWDRGRRLTPLAQALIPVLPWTIPALLWVWLAAYLAVPGGQSLPRLLLLGVWPAIDLLLRLTRAELLTPGLPGDQVAVRQGFYRRLRWGLIATAVVSIVYILTRALPVSPLVTDLLDRLAMVGLLLLAVPACGLKRLILDLARAPDPRSLPAPASGEEPSGTAPVAHDRPGPRLLAWLSQVAALALVAAGLLGLLGFLNLAWAIAINLGWLALVAALLYLTGGALDDLFNVAARRLPAMAAAWGLRRRWG